MTTSTVKTVRVRHGLYQLSGVTHTQPDYPGAEPCGGQVYAERFGGSEPGYLWECFCEKCGRCDWQGYGTLAECVKETPGHWSDESEATP